MHLSFKLIGNDAIRQAIDHFLTMVCCNIFAFPNDANLKKKFCIQMQDVILSPSLSSFPLST